MGTALCSRSGAARLVLGLGLGTLLENENEACSVRGWRPDEQVGPPSNLAAGRRRVSPSVPASWFTCCSERPPSAAMSVVILHFDFGKLCVGLRLDPPPFPDSQRKDLAKKRKNKKPNSPTRRGRKIITPCVCRAWLFNFFLLVRLRLGVDLFHLVKGLQAFSFKRLTNF